MSTLEPTPLKLRWYFSVAAVLVIFVVIGIYSTRMADNTSGYDQQQAVIRLAKLRKMQATDHTTLTTADWIDQTKGTVRIPIDEAMTEEVAVLKAKPVAMGSALPAATPAAAAPAATNAAPAASGTPPASTNSTPAATGPAAANPNPAK